MSARRHRTRQATLRAVRIMVALRLVGRAIAAPAPAVPGKSNNRRGNSNSGKGATRSKRDRCEGEAPEGTSGAATVEHVDPANASPARPIIQDPAPVRIPREAIVPAQGEPIVRAAPRPKISLAGAPSGMDIAAARWRSPVAAGEAARNCAARQAAEGRAFCKCGGNGNEGGYVPGWFGRDCIEVDCPLRGKR